MCISQETYSTARTFYFFTAPKLQTPFSAERLATSPKSIYSCRTTHLKRPARWPYNYSLNKIRTLPRLMHHLDSQSREPHCNRHCPTLNKVVVVIDFMRSLQIKCTMVPGVADELTKGNLNQMQVLAPCPLLLRRKSAKRSSICRIYSFPHLNIINHT